MSRHKRWGHPYYWAGFQLQGDWNVVDPAIAPSDGER
jgi:hypothetical protein